jgi:3',5'-cyclic AMP phosphodiesterase CpdA
MAIAQNSSGPQYALVHLSDFHFGRFLKNTTSGFIRKIFGVSEHSYSLAVSLCDEFRRLHARFANNLSVVVTGDLTTSANIAAFSVVANYVKHNIYAAPGQLVGLNLGESVHILPGNHDIFLKSIWGIRNRADVYKEYFPAQRFSICNTPLGYVVFSF